LDFGGLKYPGIAAKTFAGLPLDGMRPNWNCTLGRRGLIVPGKLFVLYLPNGGGTSIFSRDVPRSYRVYDPRTGEITASGKLEDADRAKFSSGRTDEPRVAVFVKTD
jgi:hypothetical protein